MNYLEDISLKKLITLIKTEIKHKVPISRTINGKSLSANITLSASDIGAQAAITGTAGQFVVIGDDGNVTTLTVSNAEGVSF